MNGKTLLYIDQYGYKYVANTVRDLQKQLGGRIAKMYQDKKDGTTVHCGYIVGSSWLTFYQPFEITVK